MRAEDIITVVAFYNEALLLQLNQMQDDNSQAISPSTPLSFFLSVCLWAAVSLCQLSVAGKWKQAPVHYLCEITGFILFLLPSFISRRLLRFC